MKVVFYIGWNNVFCFMNLRFYGLSLDLKYYYVYLYKYFYVKGELESYGWVVVIGIYGIEIFVGVVVKGNVLVI